VLRTRVISAIVLLAMVAVPTILGGLPFFVLVAAAGALAAWEYVGLMRQGGYEPILLLCLLVVLVAIAAPFWSPIIPTGFTLALLVAGSLVATLWHRSAAPVTDWALTLAGALYLGVLMSYFVFLRGLDDGLAWVLTAAAAVMVADAGAYFAGRAFGRHPWWPRHSPKKTWEGYLAGAALGALATVALGTWLLNLSLIESLGLGLAITLLAPLGDLAESMIKRQVGAKDSSNLIPGHGGVLDRLDSLLIALPVAYFWATLMPRWPV
jgi:phosphatidate cytidylyltransferase